MSERLARVLSGAIVLGCIATIAVTMVALGVRSGATPPQPPPAYPIGDSIDVPAGAHAEADHTVIIFARDACAACQRAKDLLKDVVASLRSETGVAVAFVSDAAAEQDERRFAAAIGVAPSEVWLVDIASLRLARVPTIALVDRNGVIIKSWEGSLEGLNPSALAEAIPLVAME